jgi:4-hydroxybenzoate polyprenyltransferase
MKGILLLTRPVNLIIIAVTMYSIRSFLIVYEQVYNVKVLGQGGERLDFFLLVLSTVFIAAAGNAINDYFDVKADRINRPDKMVIGRLITRRKAILVHWICNFVAFGIAIILGIRSNSFWYLFIHLLSINALWLYSLYLQKKPFIGNFVIAGLTALVAILCGVHFYIQQTLVWQMPEPNSTFTYWLNLLVEDGKFIWLLAFFAFVNNFAREIIKDVEDMKGDQEMDMKTLPLVYGRRTTKVVVGIILLLPILFFSLLFYGKMSISSYPMMDHLKIFLPVLLSLLADALAILFVFKAQVRQDFIRADRFVKLAMILGVLTPFYWLLLWI